MYLGTELNAIESGLPVILDKLTFLLGITKFSVPNKLEYGANLSATRFTLHDVALYEVSRILNIINEPGLSLISLDVNGRELVVTLSYNNQLLKIDTSMNIE